MPPSCVFNIKTYEPATTFCYQSWLIQVSEAGLSDSRRITEGCPTRQADDQSNDWPSTCSQKNYCCCYYDHHYHYRYYYLYYNVTTTTTTTASTVLLPQLLLLLALAATQPAHSCCKFELPETRNLPPRPESLSLKFPRYICIMVTPCFSHCGFPRKTPALLKPAAPPPGNRSLSRTLTSWMLAAASSQVDVGFPVNGFL